MSEIREGVLFYNDAISRYDIRFGLEEYYGGLHCGECFEIQLSNSWIPVRIEMNMENQWYLVGLPSMEIAGLKVRR